jgi:hypothetical protein
MSLIYLVPYICSSARRPSFRPATNGSARRRTTIAAHSPRSLALSRWIPSRGCLHLGPLRPTPVFSLTIQKAASRRAPSAVRAISTTDRSDKQDWLLLRRQPLSWRASRHAAHKLAAREAPRRGGSFGRGGGVGERPRRYPA